MSIFNTIDTNHCLVGSPNTSTGIAKQSAWNQFLQVVVAVPVLDLVLDLERAVDLDPVVTVPVLDPVLDLKRVDSHGLQCRGRRRVGDYRLFLRIHIIYKYF